MRSTLLLIAILALTTPTNAGVMIEPKSSDLKAIANVDAMDDATISGLQATSTDGAARLFFICDSRKPAPVVVFAQTAFITLSGNGFTLYYRLDKGKKIETQFHARSEGTSGSYSPWTSDARIAGLTEFRTWWNSKIRTWEEYHPTRQRMIDKHTLPAIKRQTHQIIAAFLAAKTALVRVVGFNGKTWTHRFDLPARKQDPKPLVACYTPPNALAAPASPPPR